jgi:hypothetical protein
MYFQGVFKSLNYFVTLVARIQHWIGAVAGQMQSRSCQTPASKVPSDPQEWQFQEISSLVSYYYIYLSIAINKCMRIFELEKPKTPEQLRLDQLRATSKRASDALKIERDRQKAQRAQKTLQKLRSPALNTPI